MSSPQVDPSKRTWLIASTCAGVVGGVATAVPFVSTFLPSERARAAGAAVEADIGGLKPGEKMTVEWRGKPVWIIRRTPEQLESLKKTDALVADPKSERKPAEVTPMENTRNEWRVRREEPSRPAPAPSAVRSWMPPSEFPRMLPDNRTAFPTPGQYRRPRRKRMFSAKYSGAASLEASSAVWRST